MNSAISRDMTEGSEAGHIVRFALPLLAGNILQQLYNVADTMIVGRYVGDDALAAVGATGSVTFFFYTLCLGLAIGAGVIISQLFGAGEKRRVKSAIYNSAVITLIFGLAVSIISVIFAKPALILLNTPENLLETSVRYMKIACGGTIAVAAYNWINSVMRSLGDSKTPLIFLGIASGLNIVLDLLFVVGFNLGVSGAAAATVLAQSISAISCIIYAFAANGDIRLLKSDMRIESGMIFRCIKTGVPIAVQNGLISVSMIALQRVTNSFGETVMAAYTVSMRIEQFIQQPFSSLNAAVSAFIGQNTGAGKNERVICGYKISMKIMAALSAAMLAVFWIFAEQITGLFVSGSEVIRIGAYALRLTSCFYIFLGTIHVTRGFLNGAGDTGYALVNGMAEVLCRIAFSVVLTRIPAIGYRGIWGTTCITWFATALISFIRYLHGKWKSKAIVNNRENLKISITPKM